MQIWTTFVGSPFEPWTMAFERASRSANSTSHSFPTAQPICLTASMAHLTTGLIVDKSAGPEKFRRITMSFSLNSHDGRGSEVMTETILRRPARSGKEGNCGRAPKRERPDAGREARAYDGGCS